MLRIACAAASLALAGCATVPAADFPAVAPGQISEATLKEVTRTLSLDEFEGRAPGTPGEEKTLAYLVEQFTRAGLQPGNHGSWFQDVPLVEITASDFAPLTVSGNGASKSYTFGSDWVGVTYREQRRTDLAPSEIVFVGYGINAPEKGWNDYAGIDMRGKTALILVNDPDYEQASLEGPFNVRAMTYYGRWTYKYEEAARQGAAAALIIHDTEGASYGWDVVKNSWTGPQFDLPAKDDPEPRLPAQGWITGDVARELMAGSGQDLDALYKAANRKGFEAVELDATMSLELASTSSEKSSQNVIAKLPGTTRPDEAVIYMGHWDHLGDHGHEGEAGADADSIYNGAIDNATGIAGILEIAEAFVAQEPAPERSVLFLAVTLEESGLLGSKYYVAHPSVPLDQTVAAINLDAMPVIGKTRDITVVGLGNSEL